MNSILLDSHVLLWLLFKPDRLSVKVLELIETANVIYVSTASLWELILKYNKGKLDFAPKDILSGYKNSGIILMPIKERHLELLEKISLPQKDPFDTLLVAQAKSESLPLLTADIQLINSNYKTIDARQGLA